MVRCTSADFIFLVNFYAHLTPNQGDIIYHTQEHYLFKNTRVPPRPAAAPARIFGILRARHRLLRFRGSPSRAAV